MRQDPSLRASHADRERVVDLLREQCAEGRLTTDELDERLTSALTAKTIGELESVTQGLPRPPPPAGPPRGNERAIAALCHAAAFSGLIGFPFGNIVGPLAFWLAKRRDSPFVDKHGRAALNYHISATIYAIMLVTLLVASIVAESRLGITVSIVAAIGLILLGITTTVIGTFRAAAGHAYRYPLAVPFLR